MPEPSALIIFATTFFFISLSPGLCMSLAMSLGMTFGIKKTLYMMMGELIGVAFVAIAAVIGVASIILKYPHLFIVIKWLGGLYLIYSGLSTIKRKVTLNNSDSVIHIMPSNTELFVKGFITAVANPKGWAFMISIFPPFINGAYSLVLQLSVFISIIMMTEFVCMLAYASGGKTLRNILNKNNKAQWINRIGGGLLILVGIWLALS